MNDPSRRWRVDQVVRVLAFVGALVFLALSVRGDGGEYLLTAYGVREGMAQNQTTALFQDRDGYVWVGTFGGLSRYDGRKFRNFFLADGLPSTHIMDISQDADGAIWVGTRRGLARLVGDRFVHFELEGYTRQPPVRAVCHLPDRSMVVATGWGLVRVEGEHQRRYLVADGLASNSILGLALLPSGCVLVGTESGLNILSGASLASAPEFGTDPSDEILPQGNPNAVRRIRPHSASGEIILTRQRRVTLVGRDGLRRELVPDPSGDTILWDAVKDRDGVLWVASTQGLFRYVEGEGWGQIGLGADLGRHWLYTLWVDYEDSLWIGGDRGLLRLSNRHIRLHTVATGLRNNVVWMVKRWGEELVVSQEEAVQLLSADGRWRDFPLPGRYLFDLHPRPDGTAVLGTDVGVLVVTRGGVIRLHNKLDEQYPLAVHCLRPVGGDEWIVGADRTVFVGPLRNPKAVAWPAPYQWAIVYDIEQAGADAWWLGTDQGLFRLERAGQDWSVSGQVELVGHEVQCLARGPGGEIYAGVIGGGLYHSTGDGFTPLPMIGRLPSDNVWCLYVDRAGVLWVGTSRGVAVYRNRLMQDFNAIHGLPADEVTNTQSILQDRDGRFYICTQQGLIVYTPGGEEAPVVRPRVHITAVEVNGAPVNPHQGRVGLGHSDRLTIQFNCFSFLNERGNRFQYQFEGVDPLWSPLFFEDHVYYPYLPPGNHVFRVRAFNSQGVPGVVSPELRVDVSPPLTRTPWFLVLVVVLTIGVGIALIGWKVAHDRRDRFRLRQAVEQKTAELTRSEELYRELITASPVGVLILQNRRIVFCNPMVTKMIGLAEGTVRNEPLERLVHPDDMPMVQEYIRLRDAGDTTPHEYELRIVAAGGDIKVVMLRSTVTRFNGQPAVLANVLDLTEKKRLLEQLLHYQKVESVGVLAGGIAHDFNNILQGITGHTSLMRLQIPDADPIHNELVMIEDACQKASSLTRKLLGFARKGKYVVSHFRLQEVIDAVIDLSRRSIPYNVTFQRQYPPDPVWIQGDRSQFEQVFLNLFLNSRDAMPEGGEIRVEVRLVEFDDDQPKGSHSIVKGAYVEVVVVDTGGGIDPEVLPRILDPFFTTKPHGQGSGLGLATVYGIVKNHQGYFYIDSEWGRSTRATILVPPATPGGPNEPPAADLPDTGRLWPSKILQGRRVLVVEDESINRVFLRKLLQKYRVVVMEAEDGQQAVRLFRAHADEIDLVLLDVNMPVLDGRGALREIVAMRPDIPVIILSGYGEDANIRKMLAMGGRDYIQKPVDSARLLAMLETVWSSEAGGARLDPDPC